MASFGGAVKLTGESEYRKALTQITQNLKEVSSQIKLVDSEYEKNDKSTSAVSAKSKVLTNAIEQQKNKLTTLQAQYSTMEKQYSSNLTKHNALLKSYEDEKTKLELVGNALGTTSKEYQTQAQKVTQLSKDVAKSNSAIEQNEKAMSNIRIQMNSTQIDINKTSKEFENLGKETKNSFNQAGEGAIKFGDILKANVLSDLVVGGIKAVGGAIKEISSKIGDVAKESLNARGELEQQVGGIETLFKESSNIVIDNANKAYETAGMSAVDYMSTATSFSASLLQSLGGDTKKVAEVTDMAIIDMSDNANKMGTSMESIQSAYQGFAKQNYTMLDNLKLGYGGTKGEMERLLQDAEKISGVKYDISNLSDVYNAIHVIQGELDITGTTAEEASATFQGSMSSMKSAWSNFLSGSGNVNQLIDTALTVVKNISRIAQEAIPQIIGDLKQSMPEILKIGKDIIQMLLNGISTYLPDIIEMAMDIIDTLFSGLIDALPNIIEAGVQAITQLITGLAKALPDIIPQAINAVITIAETLLDNIDMLIDAGIELIFALADGLIEALPQLIEKIPEIIDKLIMAIANNLPKIIEAGITLIIKLGEGLIKAIPQLIEKIPQIINSLINGFKTYYSKIGEIGLNIVKGIWNGISDATQWILDRIKEFGSAVLNGIKSIFGIHSPSTIFRDEVGKNLALGIGEGFSDEMRDVSEQMQNSIPTDFDLNTNIGSSGSKIDVLVNILENYLPQLLNASNKQLVLDTGVLVGATVEQFDSALGNIQIKGKRGN